MSSVTHIAVLPYPGRGHINPALNLCRLLASRYHDHVGGGRHLLITFVVTEEWLGLLSREPLPANLHLRSIPNVLPSESTRSANYSEFLRAVEEDMKTTVEHLLDGLADSPAPPGILLADAFLSWANRVAARRGMPAFSLFTQSASVLTTFLHSELIVEKVRRSPANVSERADEVIDCVPGIQPMRMADLPSVFFDDAFIARVVGLVSSIPKTRGILLPSFDELERETIDHLKANLPVPLYALGPCIPFMLPSRVHLPLLPPVDNERNHHYFDWLDSQPLSSVLYVSLGSFLVVSALQMEELTAGLRDSGVRRLQVVQGVRSSELQGVDGGSLEVGWCDQLKVLCHPAVGGFLTHCGWNSTLEGIYAGVPLLTFPLFADQSLNSKLAVDDWKIGVRMSDGQEEKGGGGVVGRETIAKSVRMVMDLDDHRSQEMRARARNLREFCHGALEKDGSSGAHLDSFIRDLLFM